MNFFNTNIWLKLCKRSKRGIRRLPFLARHTCTQEGQVKCLPTHRSICWTCMHPPLGRLMMTTMRYLALRRDLPNANSNVNSWITSPVSMATVQTWSRPTTSSAIYVAPCIQPLATVDWSTPAKASPPRPHRPSYGRLTNIDRKSRSQRVHNSISYSSANDFQRTDYRNLRLHDVGDTVSSWETSHHFSSCRTQQYSGMYGYSVTRQL